MSSIDYIQSFRCKKDLYQNIDTTNNFPALLFKVGKLYAAKTKIGKIIVMKGENDYLFFFHDNDRVAPNPPITKYFYTMEEYRDLQLQKLIT